MSGDTPCDIGAIWKCPFCGAEVINAEVESLGIQAEGKELVNVLILRTECADKLDENLNYKSSAEYTCPAMIECGAYYLHIYPDGHCHAYYY